MAISTKLARIDKTERVAPGKLPDAPRFVQVQLEAKGEFTQMNVSKLPAFRGQYGWYFYDNHYCYRPIANGPDKGKYKRETMD